MEYLTHIAILVSIYGILGLSLNLVVGFTGLLSVTHAAFYGTGAYGVAILMTRFGTNFFLALTISIIITAIISFLIGAVFSRFKGDYYALGSLGFNVIIWSVFLNWQELTRGPLGIPGIKRPEFFGFSLSENIHFLILSLIFLSLVYLACRFIEGSSFGRVLRAVREDEKALQIFGYNTPYFKLAVFVFSAAMAAIAGGLYASYITFIDPSTFTLNESIFILAIIILGGLASNNGSMVGALILVLLPEILRFVGFPSEIAAQMRQVAYGVILIVLMLCRPQGILGRFRF